MLTAYFDESEHTDSGWFCIAGYAFHSRELRRFNKEWRRLMGIRELHMKHLVHGRGEFEGVPHPERNRILEKAASIIARTAAVGAVAFCQASEIEAALSTCSVEIMGFDNPYSICHHYCMAYLGDWSRKNNAGVIAYVFDDGYKGKHSAFQFMEDARKIPAFIDSYQCYSHTFANSRALLPLQAADFLAYEWIKNWRERATPPPRDSFSALLSGKPRIELMPIYKDNITPLFRLLENLAPPEDQK